MLDSGGMIGMLICREVERSWKTRKGFFDQEMERVDKTCSLKLGCKDMKGVSEQMQVEDESFPSISHHYMIFVLSRESIPSELPGQSLSFFSWRNEGFVLGERGAKG